MGNKEQLEREWEKWEIWEEDQGAVLNHIASVNIDLNISSYDNNKNSKQNDEQNVKVFLVRLSLNS